MLFNILIGGSAGQGMDTIAALLEKAIQRNGLFLFSNKDYMSRVRGGHNFVQIRFGDKEVFAPDEGLDLILALDLDTYEIHSSRLKASGVVLHDNKLAINSTKAISLPLTQVATKVKLLKSVGSVAVGVILKYFGITLENVELLFPKKFAANVLNGNIEALKQGYNLLESKYSLPKNLSNENILLNGNTAIALGALAGGLSFYSAYPMTPATSVMTYLAKKAKATNIVVEQVEDEIAAINMAIGASYAGARAMTGSSGGGFSLMVEALGLAGITETPLVVIDSQRPGPATGLPTRTEQSDLSFLLTASHGEFPRIVTSVRNPEDAFYTTFRALNLAEKYQTLVLILTDQYLADYNQTIKKYDLDSLKIEKNTVASREEIGEDKYLRYKVTESGISPRLIPGKIEGEVVLVDSDEHSEEGHITESAEVRIAQMEKRMRKLDLIKNDLVEPDLFGAENPEILLVGFGSTWGALKEATEILNKDGIKVASLSFGDLYPLPTKKLKDMKSKCKQIINVEQNFTGQLGKLIAMETGILMDESILKYDGRQLTPMFIVNKVKKEVN